MGCRSKAEKGRHAALDFFGKLDSKWKCTATISEFTKRINQSRKGLSLWNSDGVFLVIGSPELDSFCSPYSFPSCQTRKSGLTNSPQLTSNLLQSYPNSLPSQAIIIDISSFDGPRSTEYRRSTFPDFRLHLNLSTRSSPHVSSSLQSMAHGEE